MEEEAWFLFFFVPCKYYKNGSYIVHPKIPDGSKPPTVALFEKCVLPYQKDPSKGKPEDFGAELIYVGKLKVCEALYGLAERGKWTLAEVKAVNGSEEEAARALSDSAALEAEPTANGRGRVGTNARSKKRQTQENDGSSKKPRTSAGEFFKEDENERVEAEETHLTHTEKVLKSAQCQLEETKTVMAAKKRAMDSATTKWNNAMKANNVYTRMEPEMRMQISSCLKEISLYEELKDAQKPVTNQQNAAKKRMNYLEQELERIAGDMMNEQQLGELRDKELDARSAYTKAVSLHQVHSEAVEKLMVYFDAAKKLDEQQKEIARKQKDDKETMKKLIENVLKQQELILGTNAGDTPRRPLLSSRLPDEDDMNPTSSLAPTSTPSPRRLALTVSPRSATPSNEPSTSSMESTFASLGLTVTHGLTPATPSISLTSSPSTSTIGLSLTSMRSPTSQVSTSTSSPTTTSSSSAAS